MTKQTHAFQAEVKQILHLVTHSLYSNKEIFLRELVSNASDACDKLRFEALDNGALYENDSELKIRIGFDAEARTITIADNGVGMSRDEAIAHLGTIAKSGTREFFAKLTGDAKQDASLIGQFGVGFYSAFMVAKSVKVYTHSWKKDEPGHVWTSDGSGSYEIEEAADQPERCYDRRLADLRRVKQPAWSFEKDRADLFHHAVEVMDLINTGLSQYLLFKGAIVDGLVLQFFPATAMQ